MRKKELKKINKTPKIIKLNLTECKSLSEIHERIQKTFGFPEWYGKNWSAFWDLLWSECDADKVEIFGEHTLESKFNNYLKIVHNILDDLVDDRANSGYLFEYEIID